MLSMDLISVPVVSDPIECDLEHLRAGAGNPGGSVSTDLNPFFRCLHGYGLCLWRLGKVSDAGKHFERMLWLNPSDDQGVRFLLDEVQKGVSWDESKLC
jgi:hypothetical protein